MKILNSIIKKPMIIFIFTALIVSVIIITSATERKDMKNNDTINTTHKLPEIDGIEPAETATATFALG